MVRTEEEDCGVRAWASIRVCARERGLEAGWRAVVEYRSTIGRLHGRGSLSDVLVRLCATAAPKY